MLNTPVVVRRSDRDRRRYDARSSTGVRIRALIKEFTAALAGGKPSMAGAIRRAAKLQALAEDARAAAVRTGTFNPIALTRIERLAESAKRKLGLDAKPQRSEQIGPLGRLLRQDQEAQRARLVERLEANRSLASTSE